MPRRFLTNGSEENRRMAMNIGLYGIAVIVAVFLFWIKNSLYVIKEWERGVVLRLGKLMPHAKTGGVNFVFYPIDKLTRISLRLETMDVPPQDIITHDNVSVKVNAVCYFRVVDANLAISQVMNYQYATSQLAQTTLRSIVGQFDLDEILSQRDKVNGKLQIILDQDTEAWGIKATKVLETQKSAIQLRYLQTLTEIGVEKDTTIVFPLPIDIINSWVQSFGEQNK